MLGRPSDSMAHQLNRFESLQPQVRVVMQATPKRICYQCELRRLVVQGPGPKVTVKGGRSGESWYLRDHNHP